MASPSPGVLGLKGSAAVADYLLSHGIRYVAFSYVDQAGYAGMEEGLKLYGGTRLLRQVLPRILTCLNVLKELARTRKLLFDDGHVLVMDLSTPA